MRPGLAAVDGMLNNEVDIATTSEFVLVGKAFNKEKLAVAGTFNNNEFSYLVGRKDRGISDVPDLKGKSIGLNRGGIAEFYLGRFLDLRGMNIRDVTLVNTGQLQARDDIISGKVDAVVARISFANQIRQRLRPEQVVAWPVQNNQPAYGLLVAGNDFIARHPELVRRFLKSIAESAEFVTGEPARAKKILRQWLKYDDSYIDSVWPENQFTLSLDLSLIAALEDQARWMMGNDLTGERRVPDFKDYIYVDGLKAVKPEGVNISR